MSFAATILALSLGLTDCLHARTWTNAQGRTVEAEFEHEEGANVVLKLTNGKSVPVPLATLSSADQAFVASTRKPTPPVAPVAPPPEPVPPPDKFPVFDFGLATTGGSTNEGRVIQLWDALKVTTPKTVERVAFEKSLRFMLGGQRLAEHLGFSKTTLASKELPLTISVFSTAAETGKAARYSQPCPHFLKDDGRMFFSATFANLLSGAEAETGDGDLAPSNVVDSQHRNALGGALCAQRDLLPSWLYEAARQYGQMLPWEEQWPQYSQARIAMKKFLSQVAERKAFLITPGLIDNILTQPLARIPSNDAPNLAAALATLFYLRHLHGDGSGSELKSILATTMTQQQERRAYLAKVAEYDEVWDQIHADPRTQRTANGGYTFSSNYVVPDEPKPPHTEEAIQESVEMMNKAVLAALGAKPGETIVAGLIKAGFTNGIADDSGKLAAGGVSATDMAAAPAEDLTPDYSQVKPARPHLPLVNRTWPVEIMVSTGAMNPTLVKSQEKGAIYRVGKFQFEAGSQLSLQVVKEIARIFTALEELVERMPWDITPTPANGQWFVAKLYPNLEDYKKIAPPSSGGFYSLKEKVFHVPYQALGLTGGRPDGSAVNGVNSDTLVHELTHMMMDRIIPYVPIWVAEGSAEYVETIPLSNNAMRPADIPQAIKTYVGKMSYYPEKIKADYGFRTSSKRMLEVMRMSSKSWHEFAGTAPSQKAEPPTPTAEGDKTPQAQPPAELDPKVVSAKQHELYMHACMLFYYFMHLDNAQRGDPMLTFLDQVTDNAPKWELFTKALTTYLERLNGYKVSWDAFAALPGVTRLPDGKINYPATMKPPVAPKPPRAPVDTDKLKSLDRSFAYINVLIKGRSDEDLMKAFKVGFAKIGIEID